MTSAIHSDLVPRQLTTGAGAPILVVDFVPLSAGASLSSLLGASSRGHPVYAIDPVSDLVVHQNYLSVADLASAYAAAFLNAEPGGSPGPAGPAGLSGTTLPHIFVIGYCSAAPLALHIARLLTSTREISITLVRPSWPDATEIALEFAALRKGLGVVDPSSPNSDGDPEDAIADMTKILHGDLISMATEHGLDIASAVLTELLNRYRAWLAFLVAGRQAEPMAPAGGPPPPPTPSIEVFTGTADDAIPPEFDVASCRITRLPILDQEPYATPELAELVLAQFDDVSNSVRS